MVILRGAVLFFLVSCGAETVVNRSSHLHEIDRDQGTKENLDLTSLGYCDSKGTTTYEYIDQVTINDVVLKSGNNQGYHFETKSLDVPWGTKVKIKLKPGFSYSSHSENWSVFFDANQDKKLKSDEKVFSGKSKTILEFLLDTYAKPGKTLLRISMGLNPRSDACGSFSDGEVEDIVLNIQEPTTSSDQLCASKGKTALGWINSVAISDNDKHTTGDNGGYFKDSDSKARFKLPINAGANYYYGTRVNGVFKNGQSGWNFGAWIDFNGDNVFGDGERILSATVLDQGSYSNWWQIPLSAKKGLAKMRVTQSYGKPDPCATFFDGEVEDYQIDITAKDCGNTEHLQSESRMGYRKALVPIGQNCESENQSRTCMNGNFSSWDGVNRYDSCTVSGKITDVPPSVENLRIDYQCSTQANVKWESIGGSTDRFLLKYCIYQNNQCYYNYPSIETESESLTFVNLTPDRAYRIEVFAVNKDGLKSNLNAVNTGLYRLPCSGSNGGGSRAPDLNKPIRAVAISPSLPIWKLWDTRALDIVVYYTDGTVGHVLGEKWNIQSDALQKLGDGYFKAVKAGVFNIEAEYKGHRASTRISIWPR